MTIYTTLPDGKTLSTSVLDTMWNEALAMTSKDVYGNVVHLKSAMKHEALYEFWELRNRTFNDSGGCCFESRMKAAEHYRKYAEKLESMRAESPS